MNLLNNVTMPTRGDVLHFAFMPDIRRNVASLPPVLSILVMIFARVFHSVDLLPAHHPILRGEGCNLKGFCSMLVEASGNIKWSWHGIPQLVIYYSVIGVIIGSIATIFLAISNMAIGTAMANTGDGETGQSGARIFEATGDLGIAWIDLMFHGLQPSSELGAQVNSISSGFALALGDMLRTYSYGTLVLAGIIISYSLASIVTETAHQGSVMGRENSEIWGPLRLIFALGILVPLATGINSGQAMVLQFSKWGSALATNTWSDFSMSLVASQTLDPKNLPEVGGVRDLVRQVLIMETCMATRNMKEGGEVVVRSGDVELVDENGQLVVHQWGVSAFDYDALAPSYIEQYDTRGHVRYDKKGSVGGPDGWITTAYCGAVNFQMPDSTYRNNASASNILAAHQRSYVYLSRNLVPLANVLAAVAIKEPNSFEDYDYAEEVLGTWATDQLEMIILGYQAEITSAAEEAYSNFRQEMVADFADRTQKYGWVAAGTWFMDLTRLNAEIMSAASAIPQPEPRFQPTARQFEGSDTVSSFGALLEYVKSGFGFLSDRSLTTHEYVEASVDLANKWFENAITQISDRNPEFKGDADIKLNVASTGGSSAIGRVLGFLNLQSTLENFSNNVRAPMLALIQLGQDLKAVALTGFAVGAALGIGSTTMGLIAATFAFMVMGGAYTLSIVLPLMPAVRFVFGVMTWLLAIFEAIVAIPVLALAHLRMDAQGGLTGGMAQSGYLLLLQLFLRPVLMILGLVGSIMVFNITMEMLNMTFMLAAKSSGNSGVLATLLDPFFYIVMYVGTAYTLANMSFKIIYMVPDQVLRYIGGSPSSTISGASSAERMAGIVSGKTENIGRGMMGGVSTAGTTARGFGAGMLTRGGGGGMGSA